VVAKEAVGRSRHLPFTLRAGCWVGACIWIIALSAPLRAQAVEYTPPTTPFTEPGVTFSAPSYTGTGTGFECPEQLETVSTSTEKYLYWLVVSSRALCKLSYEGQRDLNSRLFWLTDELIKEREKVETLHADLVTSNERLNAITVSLSSGGVLFGELKLLHEDLSTGQVHKDLTATEGVPVRVIGQKSAIEVSSVSGGLKVSNQPSLAGVESASLTTAETGNQNLWAICGFFVGFGLLALIYKLVRP
jgi:hypothetical protein